ncbi:MAG: quinone oxidoreductase [Gammaproteobacteria bacterium]|nr:quinone oxidoreductase [Gammaproteobacteria bacterium]MCP5318310.1 quinone oxidoreductase [Chromatiaceae bacterium]MCW5587502.1 quinone oxidoreductase [Chromatiales bacterium]MCB1818218.1 quinone oxidoreductase [Gammaproteobacteria bacterium]MCP5430549.1 quinone oxidoreductase [Chromatiaceae bacterium]
MTQAIRIHSHGNADVLRWEGVTVRAPGPGEVSLRQTACGLNFIDVYQRDGLYPAGELPAVLGMEAAGVIEALGEGVDHFAVGDRVAYPMCQGAYAQARVIAADRLLKLPETISDRQAASIMLKGLTAQYLLFRSYPVQPGDSILVYAAAGGVGLLMCQWASHLGARVIGCVGSEEKAELARANGCDYTIQYRDEDIAAKVREFTDGEGVAAVYDSVGKDTFMASLDSLRPFGVMVSYGNASGKVEPFSPAILAPKGSLYVTRPTLATHIATRGLLEDGAAALFRAVTDGLLHIQINQVYPLSETAQAHRDLEARKTTGSTILLP